jgi:hypothetical protein
MMSFIHPSVAPLAAVHTPTISTSRGQTTDPNPRAEYTTEPIEAKVASTSAAIAAALAQAHAQINQNRDDFEDEEPDAEPEDEDEDAEGELDDELDGMSDGRKRSNGDGDADIRTEDWVQDIEDEEDDSLDPGEAMDLGEEHVEMIENGKGKEVLSGPTTNTHTNGVKRKVGGVGG